MTDSLVHVVVPYARFLECKDRRRRIAADLTPRDQPSTVDAEALPVALSVSPVPTPGRVTPTV